MSAIEAELVKATRFKAKFDDRQEHLRALLNAIDSKLSDEAYDALTDEAVDWHTKAVKAHDSKQEIPEFDDAEPAEEQDEEQDEEAAEASSEQEELPLTSPKHPLHRKPKEVEPEEAEDDETGDTEADDEGATVPEEAAEEAEAEEAPRRKPKPTPAPKKTGTPGKGKNLGGGKKPVPKQIDYESITGEKDRFGVVKGTKTAEAVQMYEKGVTSAQVVEALGARYYNILKRLTQEGHKVEKLNGGIWKLTHKDNVKKKGK